MSNPTPTRAVPVTQGSEAIRTSTGARAGAAAAPTLTAMWKGGAAASASDSVWVPLASGILILAAGAMALATKKPWLFAGLGPTAVMLAASPSHPTTRFHTIVLGHATALVCAWLALLLLGAGSAPTIFASAGLPVVRIWASALAVAVTVLVQPSLRAYHPPAAATALLVTLGAYRTTWQNMLALLGGVLVVALLGEWLRRIRLGDQQRSKRAK